MDDGGRGLARPHYGTVRYGATPHYVNGASGAGTYQRAAAASAGTTYLPGGQPGTRAGNIVGGDVQRNSGVVAAS